MKLLPGCRLAVAPRIHLDPDWVTRIAIAAGVESVDGGHFPRGAWRPSTPDELALLTAPPSAPGVLPVLGQEPPPADPPPDAVWLFRLPEHLLGAWWELLDAAAGAGGSIQELDDFADFAAKVSEFLTFKGLGAPPPVRMEAVVSAAGARSIRRDPVTGKPSGLGPTVAPWATWASEEAAPRLDAVVNLGDEPTGVVLVNLRPAEMAAELARLEPGTPVPEAVGPLVERFFRACPDYSPVRVCLGAGEGCRLPAAGLALDGDPSGKSEPDVLLLISANAAAE
jgi:hypothetical protein